MNASIGIQIVPKGKSDAEVIRIVDAVIDYIRSTGLNYFVGPLETSVEGEFGELMEIIKRCHEIAAENGADALSSYVKINYRPNGEVLTIEEKTAKHHR